MDLDLLIPTFNRATLLQKCLESIARALHPTTLNINVVILDNNSSDSTPQVAQAFVRRQSTIKFQYVFVARAGKSAALNEGISRTHSELVGMIDDDEELDENWFDVVAKEMRDPDLEYIGGPYLPNWEVPPPGWLPDRARGVLGIVPRVRRTAFAADFPGILMGGNAVIRRHTLEKVLPYPDKISKIAGRVWSGEDEAIYHRLLSIGAKGIAVPELKIYHWIPAHRLNRQYFRRWSWERGRGIGYQYRLRRFDGANILGIPRYKFREAARGIKKFVFARSERDRFEAELALLDFCGLLYGNRFSRRFEKRRAQGRYQPENAVQSEVFRFANMNGSRCEME